jgi:outer membrane protein OmpA-like peptidoglycan-associated protein
MIDEARKSQTGNAEAPPAEPHPSAPKASPDAPVASSQPPSTVPAEPQVVAKAAPEAAAPEVTSKDTSASTLATARLQANIPAVREEQERRTIPVPITFIFDEANFTGDGRKAADLLLEYLKLKHFDRITLTGHADERGSEKLNMDLSRERLDTVAHYLRKGGFAGKLDLIPKGESEPFLGVNRSEYSQDALWQLDRRVELIIPR